MMKYVYAHGKNFIPILKKRCARGQIENGAIKKITAKLINYLKI